MELAREDKCITSASLTLSSHPLGGENINVTAVMVSRVYHQLNLSHEV